MSLARLRSHQVAVPRFFIVASQTFEDFLKHLPRPPAGRAASGGDLGSLRRQISEAALPNAVTIPIVEHYRELSRAAGHGVVAVRSSAAAEDSETSSFAGVYRSLLGVSGEEKLLGAVRQVWSSCLSDEAAAYRRARDIEPGSAGFGVIVQTQVFAERAGVLFTRHPLEPDGDLAYLEANFGTGETVVGGMVTPDAISVSRSTGKVAGSRIGSKKRMNVVSEDQPGSRTVETDQARRLLPVLSASEAEQIVALGLRIEEFMGRPQDIEWAYDSARLWILQARPQTGAA